MIAALGGTYMDELKPMHIIAWLDEMAKTKSGYTCLGALRVARTMTKDAEDELGLASWPCKGVKRPKKLSKPTAAEPNALTASQLSKLWESMRATEARVFPLFATIALTGMRFCEASALEWSDVDLSAGTIEIQRAQYRGIVDTPKTEESRRNLPLTEDLIQILKQHRQTMVATQHPGLKRGLVFPSSVGTYQGSSDVNKAIKRAAKLVEITFRITAHGLRRTLNGLALQVAPGEAVRKVMGHTDAVMTAHYLHMGMDAKRELVTRAAGLLTVVSQPVGISVGTEGGAV
ncbi:MAG TPA: site-specific integrase [Kofleriaceae bacterium]|jgi:integrase